MKSKGKVPLREIRRVFKDIKEFSHIHIRICNCVDVWPTTGRYYSLTRGTKGFFNSLTELVNEVERSEKVIHT